MIMMKKSYELGGIKFSTKKECEDYTREIINSIGCCKIGSDHRYYNFFRDLITRHPDSNEKIGKGIKCFYIRPDPMDNRYYETILKRTDRTEVVFNWVQCCRSKKKIHRKVFFRYDEK